MKFHLTLQPYQIDIFTRYEAVNPGVDFKYRVFCLSG